MTNSPPSQNSADEPRPERIDPDQNDPNTAQLLKIHQSAFSDRARQSIDGIKKANAEEAAKSTDFWAND